MNNTAEPSALPRTPLRFMFWSLTPKLRRAALALLFVTVAQAFSSIQPYVFKRIVDAVEAGDAEIALWWILAYPASVAVMYAGWRSAGMVGVQVIPQITSFVYHALYRHVIGHSASYFADRFPGTLSMKLNRAARHCESLLEWWLWTLYPFLVQFAVFTLLTAITNLLIAGVFVVFVLFLIVLNIYLVKRRRPHVVAAAEAQSRLGGTIVDALSNIRTVQHFARFDFERARAAHHIDEYRVKDTYQWRLSEWVMVVNNIVIAVFVAAIVFLAAQLWQRELLTSGDLILLVTLLMSFLGTITFIGNQMNRFVTHYGEIEEGLSEILDPHEIVDAPDARELVVAEGAVAFERVTFRYYGAADSANKVFDDFTLTIAPRQRVGLVGESGAGKSSLVALLLRQHELVGGRIMIDGQNIAEVTQESLRQAIAMVPQEPMLFHRTLMENIRYGRLDATDAEVCEAARLAQADTFIQATPQGYETLVGERGVKLSGGQRQRIAIARAILKNAPILVLDEATSSLDSESEFEIQLALHELMKGKTVIAIAHRLSTLREMDRLIVLDKGIIAQDGTSEALRGQEGIYRRLWEHQSGGYLQE